MKGLRNRLLLRINIWIAAVLAMMGIGERVYAQTPAPKVVEQGNEADTTCNVLEEVVVEAKVITHDVGIPVLYGMPYATFQVDGRVTNRCGRGLKGIQVIVQSRDTVYTDKKGYFTSSFGAYAHPETRIEVNDKRGKYASTKQQESTKFSKDGMRGFDYGIGTASFKVKLERKKRTKK